MCVRGGHDPTVMNDRHSNIANEVNCVSEEGSFAMHMTVCACLYMYV